MDEMYALCDACTIFRDGRKIVTHPTWRRDARDLCDMVGREITESTITGASARRRRVRGRRIEAHALAQPATSTCGAARSWLLRSGRRGTQRTDAPGVRRRQTTAGEIVLTASDQGAQRGRGDPTGIVLCPEDRKEEGICREASVSENINISCRRHDLRAGIFLRPQAEKPRPPTLSSSAAHQDTESRQKIRLLSGGNQQKVILARWLAEPDLKVLILDEPTRGIDVGAKNEIYNVIYQVAERGCAIVMIPRNCRKCSACPTGSS